MSQRIVTLLHHLEPLILAVALVVDVIVDALVPSHAPLTSSGTVGDASRIPTRIFSDQQSTYHYLN